MQRGATWGAALWLLRPAYVVVELVVAARTTGAYRLAENTVSELGTSTCSPMFCSPWRELMNGTFVAVGLLLAAGALLLAARLGGVVTALLCLAGASSVATGLVPLDDDPALHAVVAAPLFACQPIALLLLARRVRPTHGRLAPGLLVTGVVTAAAAVGFVAGAPGAGALERLALWPPLAALAVTGLVLGPWGQAQSWPSRRSSASSSVPS